MPATHEIHWNWEKKKVPVDRVFLESAWHCCTLMHIVQFVHPDDQCSSLLRFLKSGWHLSTSSARGKLAMPWLGRKQRKGTPKHVIEDRTAMRLRLTILARSKVSRSPAFHA